MGKITVVSDHKSKNVDELKEFLSERGIKTSLYRKDALIRLAEAATEINLEPDEDGNYHSDRQTRLTVETPDGEKTVLPDIVSVKDWNTDLLKVPNVEIGDIFVYLMTTCMWSKERLRSYKSDNGYQLFIQRHVDNVVMKCLPNEHIYVKCLCTLETRQKEKPYVTWILMDTKASIKSGGCTCVADDGSCKHCVALLFSLNQFTDRHKDRGTEVCTDKPCRWDRPRQTSNPVTIQDIDFGKKDNRDNYKPFSYQVNKDDIVKSLFKVCKDHGSVFTHIVEPPSDESYIENEPAENKYLSLPELITNYKSEHEIIDENEFFDYLRNMHSKELINDIECATKDQSDCQLWFGMRKGRITASVMGSVLHCNIDKLGENNYIVKRINGDGSFFSTEATQYGKQMESVARTQYFQEYTGAHNKATMSNAGLVISAEMPFLAASPDGIIKCQCCGEGLVEIKCTFLHKHKYTKDIAEEGNYNIHIVDNKVQLMEKSVWYAQIQTQLFVTGKPWCDFVLFTQKDISVDRICFNKEYFSVCLAKATNFFFKFLI